MLRTEGLSALQRASLTCLSGTSRRHQRDSFSLCETSSHSFIRLTTLEWSTFIATSCKLLSQEGRKTFRFDCLPYTQTTFLVCFAFIYEKYTFNNRPSLSEGKVFPSINEANEKKSCLKGCRLRLMGLGDGQRSPAPNHCNSPASDRCVVFSLAARMYQYLFSTLFVIAAMLKTN